MAKAIYWVMAKTLWQGDSFTPIAGGFTDKAEAEKVAEENADDGWTKPVWSEQHQAYWSPVQNLKNVVKTIVVNTTTMKRDYGWTKERAYEMFYYRDIELEMRRQAEEEDQALQKEYRKMIEEMRNNA